MNYYKFLNESFNKILLEKQQVVINFENIFGADTYEKFKTVKNRLSVPMNDVSYWVRKYNEEGDVVISELENILGSNTVKRDIEGKKIPEPANTKQLVAENEFYDVYYVDSVADMIALSMKKIDGYAGAYWCIAGRYQIENETSFKDAGIPKDDAVKISQANRYFEQYLSTDYIAYFVCMPKKDGFEKHCLCFINDHTCEDWNTEDEKNRCDSDFYSIPSFEFEDFSFKGEDSLNYISDEEEDALEDGGDYDDEGEYDEVEPRPQVVFDIPVENPNDYEFQANSKEEAARAFKADAEIVDTVREPDLHIVKWHEEPVEPAGEEEIQDTGDRYSLFVFIPGEGGGPLLGQTGNGFVIQVFHDLDKCKEFAGRMPGVEIRNNRQDTEDMPECLKENFFYYNDNSWYYDL